MELNNEFRVGVTVPEAWNVLTDLERIAPMLPGAQLEEVEGDEYRGVVKVKVGPITAQYKGVASFLERDEKAGRVVLKASGRDTRGQGNANAVITATMTPDEGGTRVTVVTDLTVSGKVAQFGRGALADVSSKLIGQFVDTLEADLASGGAKAGREGSGARRGDRRGHESGRPGGLGRGCRGAGAAGRAPSHRRPRGGAARPARRGRRVDLQASVAGRSPSLRCSAWCCYGAEAGAAGWPCWVRPRGTESGGRVEGCPLDGNDGWGRLRRR